MINNQQKVSVWFADLRDQICAKLEELEFKYSQIKNLQAAKFVKSPWIRQDGGGGVMAIMRGNLFEKAGVNISTVFGEFSTEFSKNIPGTENSRQFFATGISVVIHPSSPLVPTSHFNTRYLETSRYWFGGGGDLTPFYPNKDETSKFHNVFKYACDQHDIDYYPKFSKQCDEYFYLKHRNEPRGVGGIFYDYLNTKNFDNDFSFTQDVGRAFLTVYPEIAEAKMLIPWTAEQKEYQLIRRGRYVEFNLLYDRGTMFGLMTGGNVEAILMSLPPEVRW